MLCGGQPARSARPPPLTPGTGGTQQVRGRPQGNTLGRDKEVKMLCFGEENATFEEHDGSEERKKCFVPAQALKDPLQKGNPEPGRSQWAGPGL